MSQVYQRWLATLYYSNTDVLDTFYNTYGEIQIADLPVGVASTPIYISTVNYQYTPTHEIASDIAGKPYSRNRGFIDGWTLTTTPYYFDSTGTAYQSLVLIDNVMFALKFKFLWIKFTGQNLNPITTGIVAPGRAVKVVFNSFTETINNASSTRTAIFQFQRKYRFDT